LGRYECEREKACNPHRTRRPTIPAVELIIRASSPSNSSSPESSVERLCGNRRTSGEVRCQDRIGIFRTSREIRQIAHLLDHAEHDRRTHQMGDQQHLVRPDGDSRPRSFQVQALESL